MCVCERERERESKREHRSARASSYPMMFKNNLQESVVSYHSIMCISGIELRLLGLVMSAFTL